jgi:hypothetical protein
VRSEAVHLNRDELEDRNLLPESHHPRRYRALSRTAQRAFNPQHRQEIRWKIKKCRPDRSWGARIRIGLEPSHLYLRGSLALVMALGAFKAMQAGGHPGAVLPPAPLASSAGAISLWLIFRAFVSGCTAMTGVEAVSNGVPIFAEPPVKNARRTLTLIVVILGTLLAGIGFLANAYQVGAMDQRQPNYQSVISQLTAAIVGRGPLYFITIGSVLAVLTLSANTSFADFPRLCHLLADSAFRWHNR